MSNYKFDALWVQGTWLSPAYVSCDNNGNIIEISEMSTKEDYEWIHGVALPGFKNAHSHAFQFALAGRTEEISPHKSSDDFWSWREKMYKLARSLSPEHMEAIATMAYGTMIEHGYTSVAEFHYLHHQPDGSPYDHRGEMGAALVRAAQNVGIHLTLVPMFYQTGGLLKNPSPEQKRFICKNIDEYQHLLQDCEKACKNTGSILGHGIHSIRAIHPETISEFRPLVADSSIPFHIHISEQTKEVDESLSLLKRRPIEWLNENLPLASHFHLVHSTHANTEELVLIANSGAHVVLCPSTEGNLGDGIFSLIEFQKRGGNWSIGTDSHIGMSPMEELRWLDYGQRLTSHKRNPLCQGGVTNSGEYLYQKSLLSGQKAMGVEGLPLSQGQPLDVTVFKSDSIIFAEKPKHQWMSSLIFSGNQSDLIGVMTKGKWRTKDGKHLQSSVSKQNFTRTLRELDA